MRFLISVFIVLASGELPAGEHSSASPHIIIVEFHGMKNGIIAENLDNLPAFKQLILGSTDNGAYVHLPNVLTTIPAASVPACTAMYCGLFPQRTGVVSTIWFDRSNRRVRTMISYFQQRINKLISGRSVKTIFEHVGGAGKTSMSVMLMMNKGTDWSLKSGMFFWGNASTLGFIKSGRYFPDPGYMDHKTISAYLTGHLFHHTQSINGIRQQTGDLPDLTVVQLLGMDIQCHFPPKAFRRIEADMDAIQRHYTQTVLDPQMARLIRYFQKTGHYDHLIFMLVSQQGAVKIQKHLPDQWVNEILSEHFHIADGRRVQPQDNAVIMPGACTKEIYLKNRDTRTWMDPPRLLADVKPAVDALLDDPRLTEGLKAMVLRQYRGERNEGIVETDFWWGLDWKGYRAGAKTDEDFFAALKPLEETAAAFVLGDYIVEGLNRQYSRETAPDIKLINRKGVYFERDAAKYGHHGSYYPEDCMVSFWIAGPALKKRLPGRHTIPGTVSTLDLVPMTAFLMDIPIPKGLDGRNPLAMLE